MLAHRRWESLDRADHGWLRAKYHFQVNAAGNPAHQALGSLIVWNDDGIAVDSGFPLHGHRDVEIITYVRQGVLGHHDTLGSEGTIHAGDVQVMSAGTGIRHAEYNLEPDTTRLFQIWIMPNRSGHAPSWGAKPFPKGASAGRFTTLGPAVRFAATPGTRRSSAPALGEHTDEILSELGVDDEAVRALRSRGIVD